MRRTLFSAPELLEARIAPAGVLHISTDRKTATWDDVDGDKVTLKASKAVFDADDFHFIDSTFGQQLARLDFNIADQGVNLSFTAKRDSVLHLGNGSVNVGRIEATAVDLGSITISGDLGSIYAGDSILTTPAVKSLTVGSAGNYLAKTQDPALTGTAPNLGWIIEGKLGPVTVKGDFIVSLQIKDSAHANVFSANASSGAITINGNIYGAPATLSPTANIGLGFINAQGSLGAVVVHGSIDATGATDAGAGSISAIGNIAGVSVDGNLIGGSANRTGSIVADHALGNVTVKGAVRGGFTPLDNTGDVPKDGQNRPIFVSVTGAIGSSTSIGAVKIGELHPGYGVLSGAIFTAPMSGGNIKSVTVTGTLSGYTFVQTKDMTSYPAFNGIYADGRLGPVTADNVRGENEANSVPIAALGKLQPDTAADALAIASVTVKHSADSMLVIAGYSSSFTPVNPDVQIGAIKVGDNLSRSIIAAGIAAPQAKFGDATDTVISAPPAYDDPLIRSKIASLSVGGAILGSLVPNIVLGAVAQEIGSVKVGGAALELTANTRDVFVLGAVPNFTVREVGP